MRTNATITDLWAAGGAFIGPDGKPHGRVTVQGPWPDLSGDHTHDILRTDSHRLNNYASRGLPLRWFQNQANDQVEIEVENVKQIHMTRSIDQDAATCDITIYNQKMFNNAGPNKVDELGQPGYYTFSRGVSVDSQTRWSQTQNSWNNLLVPNALLRTFQGYGGTTKTITQALADGNIMLTGVWLVDHIEIHTDGTMHITCRDMAKLLLDQQLYPPLIPRAKYPLTYLRYQTFSSAVQASSTTTSSTTSSTIAVGDKRCVYETSDVDAWYGPDFELHGHRSSDSIDGSSDTFYLSVGNSRPDAAFATTYIQFVCQEQMNAVYVAPWGGSYTMYVSVMENGAWQGTDTVPYDFSELVGTQPTVVDTGANIPYVASFGVNWETPGEFVLPRVYNADRVRVSFRDLMYTDWGPWHYRAGVREFRIRGTGATSSSSSTTTLQPVFYAGVSILNETDLNSQGYLTLSDTGQVDAFGDARTRTNNGTGSHPSSALAAGIAFTQTNLGYYVLHADGRVTCFGDAVFYGSPIPTLFGPFPPDFLANGAPNIVVDILPTHTGLGYWVLRRDGTIYNYGDAPAYTAVSVGAETLSRGCAHPTAYGLFMLLTNGTVVVRGAATNYGNWTGSTVSYAGADHAVDIQCNATGTGYWILSTAGRVRAKGAAISFGEESAAPSASGYAMWFVIMPTADDLGYILMRGDGFTAAFGTAINFGAPVPGTQATLRKDGNYLDYADVIRDLVLWSGFEFYSPSATTIEVYGNIESTGSYSPEPLPTEMFDKRPVIDAIHDIKEAVGYIVWVDDEGGFRFESPNWWGPGNFDETGAHTRDMFQLDETTTLIQYATTLSDEPLRSMIIISSDDPDANLTGTITTRLIPSTVKQLRGIIKPAMWVNGYFLRPEDQKIMAELIALHTWFQSRIGQVTAVANPCLQINDQVRIWERQSAETYIHYVRGIETTMDLDSGSYTMTVTTNWLGDESAWAIQAAGRFTSGDTDTSWPVWLLSGGVISKLFNDFVSPAALQFGHTLVPTQTTVTSGSGGGTGSGPTT